MVLLGDEAQVKALSVELEIVLILMQDRFMVCAERTIGLDIILDAPKGTPWCHRSCGISFGPFGDGVSVSARKVHSLR